MYGPKPPGFWSQHSGAERKPLVLGKQYVVTKEFLDFDNDSHPPGESWRFVGSSFLPYDNGLSLFVQTTEGEWHIRLQLDSDQQGGIWADFGAHVQLVERD